MAPVAACAVAVSQGVAHPDDWFPRKGQLHERQTRRALEVCNSCELRVRCLEWALDPGTEYYSDEFRLTGIWGGTLPLERRRMKQSMASRSSR